MTTAKKFYRKLSTGGQQSPLTNGRGTKADFDDGSRVVFRPVSSSDGSPAVDITVVGRHGDQYKIDFQKTGFK